MEWLFVHNFRIELEFRKCCYFCGGRKTLGAETRTNTKCNKHMASTPGFQPGQQGVTGSKRSHHCAVPALQENDKRMMKAIWNWCKLKTFRSDISMYLSLYQVFLAGSELSTKWRRRSYSVQPCKPGAGRHELSRIRVSNTAQYFGYHDFTRYRK